MLHLWSLGVEEQFYLVLPWLLLLGMRWRGRRGLATVLAAGSVVSLLLAEHWIQIRPSIAFFQMPARFWELAAGGLVALAPRERLSPWFAGILAWLGLGALLTAMAIESPLHFPGIGAMPVVLGTVMLVWRVHDGTRPGVVGALLGSRVAVFIGVLSYSLYLWHWPLLAFLRVAHWEPALSLRLGVCALALVLAFLSHRYVETPFRRAGPGTMPRRTVLVGAGASAVLALALAGCARFIAPPYPTALDAEGKVAMQDRPAYMHSCHFGLDKEVERLQPVDCNSEAGRRASIVLWGDSHALAWQPFAWSLADASGAVAAGFTLDSCPPIRNFDTYRADFPRHRENCRRFNALALDYVRANTPDEVILAGRWLLYFQRREARGQRLQPPDSFALGIAQAVADIAPHTKKVMLIGPLPALEASAPRCMSAQEDPRCSMPREEYDRLASRVWATFRTIAAQHPNVELVDPAGFFCDRVRCPAARDGYALFWDTNHVSTTAARYFAEAYLDDPGRWHARAVAAAR